MDVLPEPDGAAPSLIRVPYLPHYSWDNGDLATFPNRHGFCNAAGQINWEHDPSNIASMMQAWLFFGVLASKIGAAFKVQDFVRRDELGQEIITLAALKGLKLSRIPLLSNEMLTRLAELRNELGVISRSFWVDTPHIVGVWNSISWLDHALNARIYAKSLKACPIQATTNNYDEPFAVYLESIQGRLDKNRWCPYNERRLGSLYAISHHYVTSLNRQHFPPFITHRNCSESSCTANAIDLEAFQTRHVEENCSCSFINVSSSDIAKVISEGSFPLIELRISANQPQRWRGGEAVANSSGSIELHIVPWKPSKDYTAISHVWSHRLGNPRSNGLPSCQLGMLVEAVSRTSQARHGTRHIWIDTLCIPVSADFAAQKRTSIDKMGLIYSAATSVLVLDYELQRIPIKTMSRMQILAHLLTCSWMERAWTFNEGSLSRSRFFQFADGIFDSKHINDIQFLKKKPRTLTECLAYYVELDLSLKLISQFTTTKSGRNDDGLLLIAKEDLENHVYYTFMNSWNILGSRSTTQPEDLVVILANLRGINLSRLFDFAPEERLAALIAFQHYVPFSFLSTPNRSKYTCLSEPNRWIPRSFDGSYISPHHQLQSNPLGDGLILHRESKEWWHAGKCLSLIMLPSDMDLNGKQSVQVCANCQKKCLQVNFLRDSHPPLDPIESISFLVLEGALERSKLTTEPQSNMKGCCLRLPVLGPTIRADIEEDECYQSTVQSVRKHIPLYFTYDCPVQVKYTEVSLGPEEESISTSCGPSKAHEIKGPWTIEIKCALSKYRSHISCRENFTQWTTDSLIRILAYQITFRAVTTVLVVVALISNSSSPTSANSTKIVQKYSYTALALLCMGYLWFFTTFLPLKNTTKHPFWDVDRAKTPLIQRFHVRQACSDIHCLFADIFIFGFGFRLSKVETPRENHWRLVAVTANTCANLLDLLYIIFLQRMLRGYLFKAWLATFEEDWSPRKYNRVWWAFYRCLGGKTPDTAFQVKLASRVYQGV